jgi:cold shock protein
VITQFRNLQFHEKEWPHMAIKGSMKWFSASKGFGFLANGAGGDVFVHISEIKGDGYKTCAESDSVQFEVTETLKGQKTAHVKKM